MPGSRCSTPTIGSRAVDTVTTTSAPRIACATVSTASTANRWPSATSSTSFWACANVRLCTRTRVQREDVRERGDVRMRLRAGAEDRELAESGRASARVATAVTAAVRTAVSAAPSTSAVSSPVSPSYSSTPPWCASIPCFAGLSG